MNNLEAALGISADRGYHLVDLQDVPIVGTRWLWRGRIALGTLTVLAGRGGIGKGTLVADLVASVTRGTLDGDRQTAGEVLILTAEDRSELWAVRLRAAGADLGRVKVLTVHDDKVGERDLALPDDAQLLRQAIQDTGSGLVVIDPLNAHLADRIDGHSDHKIRRALGPLMRVAGESDAAVLAIAHLNKGQSSDALDRVLGSVGIVNSARAVLLLAPAPVGEEGDRVVALAKTNLGPSVSSLRFRLEGRVIDGDEGPVDTVGITWLGDDPATADDLFAVANHEDRGVADWIADVLSEGPMPYGEIERMALEDGIARSTLHRNKDRIGVVVTRDKAKRGQPSTWSLPFVPGPVRQNDVRRKDLRRNRGAENLMSLNEERTGDASFRLTAPDETKPPEDHLRAAIAFVLEAFPESEIV